VHADLFQILGATPSEFLWMFKLRNSLPYLLSGLKLNATFSVIGAVVAEFVGANAGLGFGMLQASYNFNMPRLWGYILISCLLGILMYSSVWILETVVLGKKKYRRDISTNKF
jgi:NitT/TauT family transport system permease protein